MINIEDDNIELTTAGKIYTGKYKYNKGNLHLSSLIQDDLNILIENSEKIIEYLDKENKEHE